MWVSREARPRTSPNLILTRPPRFVTLSFQRDFPIETTEGRTMFYQTESKPQGWRAVAVFDDRTDRLIYLGRSSTQIRAGFAPAFFEVLDEEERGHVTSISLQRWHGAPDAGRWQHQTNLNVPSRAKVARSA
jgi:hypothetical protein